MITSLAVKGNPYRSNTPVHHVGRGYHVSSGLCVDLCLLCQDDDGLVIHDIAVGIDQSILSVTGIGVKGNISHQAKLGEVFFERGYCARYESVRIKRLARIF